MRLNTGPMLNSLCWFILRVANTSKKSVQWGCQFRLCAHFYVTISRKGISRSIADHVWWLETSTVLVAIQSFFLAGLHKPETFSILLVSSELPAKVKWFDLIQVPVEYGQSNAAVDAECRRGVCQYWCPLAFYLTLFCICCKHHWSKFPTFGPSSACVDQVFIPGQTKNR